MKIAGTNIDDPSTARRSKKMEVAIVKPPVIEAELVAGGLEWNQRRTVKSDGQRMFAAAMTSRLTGDWPISISSANAEILVSAIATRSRLRQLERDDDYMRRMLRLFQNNVIGHQGIQLQMKIREPAPALKPQPADPANPNQKVSNKPRFQFDTEANQMVQSAWKDYLKPENCTVMRNMSGVSLQRLIVRAWKRDGAIMVRKYRGFQNDFGFAVKPMEIDFLNFWNCGQAPVTGNLIQFGIEYDNFDCPIAYWILSRHPGEVFQNDIQKVFQTRVPAEDIYMIFDVDRANQLVGMPDFCSVATRLNALHRYEEAESVAARVAACKGGFISKTLPTEYDGPKDGKGNSLEEMSPGMVEQGNPGEEWHDIDPKHPMEAYGNFVKGQLRGGSAGAGLAYNTVANDLEGVNYSSFKAGRLEDTAQYQYDQQHVIDQLMQPWFEDWLVFALLKGKIKMPAAKADKILSGVNWQPRVWASVEPAKEVQADILEVEAGFATRREKIAERGNSIDDVDEEREEDQLSEKAHNIQPAPISLPTIKKGAVTEQGAPAAQAAET
jgi:lambda family phage portal protein